MQSPAYEAFGAKFVVKLIMVVLVSLVVAGLQSRADRVVRLDTQIPSQPAVTQP